MLDKTVVRGTTYESTELGSPIFIAKKPYGGTRIILNFEILKLILDAINNICQIGAF